MKSEVEEKNKEVTQDMVGQLVHFRITHHNRQTGSRYPKSIVGTVRQIGEAAIVIEIPSEPKVVLAEKKTKYVILQKELINSVMPDEAIGILKAEALKGTMHLHLTHKPVGDNRGSTAFFSRCFNGQFRLIYFTEPVVTLYDRKGDALLEQALAAGYEITSWGEEAP
jgi:hypothetical protein